MNFRLNYTYISRIFFTINLHYENNQENKIWQ
jgi:hypothetical protein